MPRIPTGMAANGLFVLATALLLAAKTSTLSNPNDIFVERRLAPSTHPLALSAPPAFSRPTTLIAGQSVVSSTSVSNRPGPSTSATTVGEEFWGGGSCIYSFGAGDFGQLALGFSESSKVPVMVEGAAAYLDENGTVVMGPPVVQCSAGGYHTLLLDLEGTVYACGDNSNGQLGVGALLHNSSGKRERLRRRCESHPCTVTTDAESAALPAMRSISAGTVRD